MAKKRPKKAPVRAKPKHAKRHVKKHTHASPKRHKHARHNPTHTRHHSSQKIAPLSTPKRSVPLPETLGSSAPAIPALKQAPTTAEKVPVSVTPSAATTSKKKEVPKPTQNNRHVIDQYGFISDEIPVTILIYRDDIEFVPIYTVSIANISPTTEIILERIRKELVKEVNLGIINIGSTSSQELIRERFMIAIQALIHKYFPTLDEKTLTFLTSYLIHKSLGMGKIEILDDDKDLEEIVINNAHEPVWVFHKSHGWLKTDVTINDEEQVKHYAAMLGRKVGRQISVLHPLMDANIEGSDRVNSTLYPISTKGNTITLRKHSTKPWTITDYLKLGAISLPAAAFLWHCVQFEMSVLVAGGTASGKTSLLNVIANFYPPNQRIISIEDTREVQLPKFLHWVPLVTRQPNTEGKGGIEMIDLVVNSLRMRPDRIIVGEIRRKQEAEILFEAIHTGHSVCATVHANDTKETLTRLTSPPIEIPRSMIPAISLIVIQYRNRRTGKRRVFQISETLEDGTAKVLMQYDAIKDVLKTVSQPSTLFDRLELFTGLSRKKIWLEIKEKEKVLGWLLKHDVKDIDDVGRIMAEFYTKKDNLMKFVNRNLPFP